MKVHLALGYHNMRKGIDGLSMSVQGVLRPDPFSGHLFVFGAAPGRISSRPSFAMVPAFVASPSGSSTPSFCGRSV